LFNLNHNLRCGLALVIDYAFLLCAIIYCYYIYRRGFVNDFHPNEAATRANLSVKD